MIGDLDKFNAEYKDLHALMMLQYQKLSGESLDGHELNDYQLKQMTSLEEIQEKSLGALRDLHTFVGEVIGKEEESKKEREVFIVPDPPKVEETPEDDKKDEDSKDEKTDEKEGPKESEETKEEAETAAE